VLFAQFVADITPEIVTGVGSGSGSGSGSTGAESKLAAVASSLPSTIIPVALAKSPTTRLVHVAVSPSFVNVVGR
jgi:hypothetical protein